MRELTPELFAELRENIKPSLPKLIAHGIYILIDELMPMAMAKEPAVKDRIDMLISGYLSMAIYADLATEASLGQVDYFFEANPAGGIKLTAGESRFYFIAYSYTYSLKFREFIANEGRAIV